MGFHAHFKKQIAGGRTARAWKALTSQTHSPAVGQALRNRHADRFGLPAAVDANICLATVDRQPKWNQNPRSDVLARHRRSASLAASLRRSASEEVSKPSTAAKQTFQINLATRKAAAREWPSSSGIKAPGRPPRCNALKGTPVAVVHFPLALIVQHIERRLNLLKLFLRGCVVGMEIWVVLPSQFSIGLTDILCRRRARHAECLVVVFRHRHPPLGCSLVG